ncbi:hypothetical protein ACN8ZM_40510 (plasmid) [Burkholderia aenigmatica]|uniref:hypothetical protein n=1 Tax=Burkholderia aenigmatica TaxID=2015348 RepID=UPI003B438AFE
MKMNRLRQLLATMIIGTAIILAGGSAIRTAPLSDIQPLGPEGTKQTVAGPSSGSTLAERPGLVMVRSYQVKHVALAGLGSALTFGVWPRDFGSDVVAVGPYQDGWTWDQYLLLRAKAYPAFRRFRSFWGCVVGIVIVSAFRRRLGQSAQSSAKG